MATSNQHHPLAYRAMPALCGILFLAIAGCGSGPRASGQNAHEEKEANLAVYDVLELDGFTVYFSLSAHYAYITLMHPYNDPDFQKARAEDFTFKAIGADGVAKAFLKRPAADKPLVETAAVYMLVSELRLEREDPAAPLPKAISVTHAGKHGEKSGEMPKDQ
jgi:hypothetical protein